MGYQRQLPKQEREKQPLCGRGCVTKCKPLRRLPKLSRLEAAFSIETMCDVSTLSAWLSLPISLLCTHARTLCERTQLPGGG